MKVLYSFRTSHKSLGSGSTKGRDQSASEWKKKHTEKKLLWWMCVRHQSYGSARQHLLCLRCEVTSSTRSSSQFFWTIPALDNRLKRATLNFFIWRVWFCNHECDNLVTYIENPQSSLHLDIARKIAKNSSEVVKYFWPDWNRTYLVLVDWSNLLLFICHIQKTNRQTTHTPDT